MQNDAECARACSKRVMKATTHSILAVGRLRVMQCKEKSVTALLDIDKSCFCVPGPAFVSLDLTTGSQRP